MKNLKSFSNNKIILLIIFCLGFTQVDASKPGLKPYRPPIVLKVSQEVVYGTDSAEVYLGVEPKFELQNPVLLGLKTSHDTLFLESESKMFQSTSMALFLYKNQTKKLHFRLKKTSNFSMASLGLTFVSYYPKKEVIQYVEENALKYSDPHRREDLIEWLKQRDEAFEQQLGVFLYGSKFVKE